MDGRLELTSFRRLDMLDRVVHEESKCVTAAFCMASFDEIQCHDPDASKAYLP